MSTLYENDNPCPLRLLRERWLNRHAARVSDPVVRDWRTNQHSAQETTPHRSRLRETRQAAGDRPGRLNPGEELSDRQVQETTLVRSRGCPTGAVDKLQLQ